MGRRGKGQVQLMSSSSPPTVVTGGRCTRRLGLRAGQWRPRVQPQPDGAYLIRYLAYRAYLPRPGGGVT